MLADSPGSRSTPLAFVSCAFSTLLFSILLARLHSTASETITIVRLARTRASAALAARHVCRPQPHALFARRRALVLAMEETVVAFSQMGSRYPPRPFRLFPAVVTIAANARTLSSTICPRRRSPMPPRSFSFHATVYNANHFEFMRLFNYTLGRKADLRFLWKWDSALLMSSLVLYRYFSPACFSSGRGKV